MLASAFFFACVEMVMSICLPAHNLASSMLLQPLPGDVPKPLQVAECKQLFHCGLPELGMNTDKINVSVWLPHAELAMETGAKAPR